ncbi:sesquipedalian [Anaeramoeba flamelloides]|uniref:Sesquipedalian n=1 Tax=Anaeramoeba flamelloides TaxID=1746091 RepID=A0AAV7YY98_9EUKA|nr:sesquipedalian [Anaeramoeba flamelloides]KAJ6233767.1 sesquipedalian [Anaeramoeba flamelloides]
MSQQTKTKTKNETKTKEGYLFRKKVIGWKKNYFCLNGVNLTFYESRENKKLLGTIDISEAHMLPETDEKNSKHSFILTLHLPGGKSIKVSTDTQFNRDLWMKHIEENQEQTSEEN